MNRGASTTNGYASNGHADVRTQDRAPWSPLGPSVGRFPTGGVPGEQETLIQQILQTVLHGRTGLYGRNLQDIWRNLAFFTSYAYAASMYNAKAVASVKLNLMMRVPKGRRPDPARCGFPIGHRSLSLSETKRQYALGNYDDSTEVIQLTKHPALELIRNPNEMQDEYEMRMKLILYLHYTGNAYLQTLRDSMDNPAGLFLLPSQFCWVDLDPRGGVSGYRIGYAAENFVPNRDISHVKLPAVGSQGRDWTGLLYGWSSVQAGWDCILSNTKAHKNDQLFYDNHGTPPFVLVPQGTISEEQALQLQNSIRGFLRNPDNMDLGMVLRHGMEVVSLNQTPTPRGMVAAGNSHSRDTIVEELCAVWGVPYAFVSNNQSTSGGIADNADPWHLKHTVIPLCNIIEQRFNRVLVKAFDDDRLFYQHEDPLGLAGNQDFVLKNLEAGIITINEARQELGYGPMPGGEVGGNRPGGSDSDASPAGSGPMPPGPAAQAVIPATAQADPGGPLAGAGSAVADDIGDDGVPFAQPDDPDLAGADDLGDGRDDDDDDEDGR